MRIMLIALSLVDILPSQLSLLIFPNIISLCGLHLCPFIYISDKITQGPYPRDPHTIFALINFCRLLQKKNYIYKASNGYGNSLFLP